MPVFSLCLIIIANIVGLHMSSSFSMKQRKYQLCISDQEYISFKSSGGAFGWLSFLMVTKDMVYRQWQSGESLNGKLHFAST